MYALYHIFPTGLLVCTVVDGLVVVVCVAWYLGCLHFMCVTPQEQEESFIQSAPQDDTLYFHYMFTLQMLAIKFLQVSQIF